MLADWWELLGTGTFYYLTVNSGSGSGNYSNGLTASLSANAVSGYNFINWSGPNIANPNLASTTATIYSNTVVTANYAQALGATSLNVADYGANGDAAELSVNTVSNSTALTTTSQLSGADVGKVIELFGAGPLGTSTNHQDLVAIITGVVNATNIVIDRVCGATTNNCYAIYGTNNAGAIQACIDAAPSNSVINIPNGTYLIIGSQVLDTNFISSGPYNTYPSLVLSKGGVTLLGQSRDNTILLGCGAWQNKGSWVYRGYMFACQGPVTNNGPLIFDSITMDGGVQQGFTGVTSFPASPATGDGWDVTHDAVIDVGLPPLHNTKIFRNCTIIRWRGEQVKSVCSGWDGFHFHNQLFALANGDGSGVNFNFTHNIDNCLFSNLFETMEFYQGNCSNTCYFQNCTVTNVQALMALNGAQSSHPSPTYVVCNNTFYPNFGNGIQTTPAQNLTISNNLFIGGAFPITIGVSGYQGSTMNSNILVVCNVFSNNWTPIEIEGNGANSLVNLLVSNNVAYGTYSHLFAESESGGWGTNMLFVNNFATNFSAGLVGSGLSGQYFIDSDSNVFPPHQIFALGGTNEIGYEFGQRHTIEAAQSTSVFTRTIRIRIKFPGSEAGHNQSDCVDRAGLPLGQDVRFTGCLEPESIVYGLLDRHQLDDECFVEYEQRPRLNPSDARERTIWNHPGWDQLDEQSHGAEYRWQCLEQDGKRGSALYHSFRRNIQFGGESEPGGGCGIQSHRGRKL